MRNLLEYPITKEEVLSILDTIIQRECDEDVCGDLKPSVLQAIYNMIDENFELLKTRLDV